MEYNHLSLHENEDLSPLKADKIAHTFLSNLEKLLKNDGLYAISKIEHNL